MSAKTYFVIYFVFLFCVQDCNSSAKVVKISKLKLTSVEECDLPRGAYDPAPLGFSSQIVTIGRDNLLSINLTVETKTLPLSTNITVYRLANNKKILDHMLDNLSCKVSIMKLVWLPFRFKFDKNCRMLPGTVVVNKFNMDYFFNNPRKFGYLDSGPNIYELQLYTKRGVMLCFSCRVDRARE